MREVIGLAQIEAAEIAIDPADRQARRLAPRMVDHGGHGIQAGDLLAAAAERDGQPAGAAAEIEDARAAGLRQVQEELAVIVDAAILGVVAGAVVIFAAAHGGGGDILGRTHTRTRWTSVTGFLPWLAWTARRKRDAGRLLDRLIVTAGCQRHALHRRADSLGKLGKLIAMLGLIQQAMNRDLRLAQQFATLVDRQADHGRAVPDGAVADAHDLAVERQQRLAVEADAADMHMLQDLGAAGPKLDQRAVADGQPLPHLAFLGQLGMGGQVARLAMDRNGDARPHPLIHRDQLVAGRMAGDMDEMVLRR